jgi:hypothetical protein
MSAIDHLAAVQKRRDEYNRELTALKARFSTHHYKNYCGSVGAAGVAPNTEFLTSDREKVNCPWCVAMLKKAGPLQEPPKDGQRYYVQSEQVVGKARLYWVEDRQGGKQKIRSDMTTRKTTAERICSRLNLADECPVPQGPAAACPATGK